ncbi:MAG: 2-oxo-4-hydroxy-4-carboxy-5-ureidoimidazoline decarboxylase [Bacteroidota bacterium]|jgi:2-oxo-4-hydroxy-4-carboxy-5-ureidoimidazoline decarboxylase
MTLHDLNTLTKAQLKAELFKCCGSTAWVQKMLPLFPVKDVAQLLQHASHTWQQCTEADWLQAFAGHPKIGDMQALKKKFASTAAWASGEQGAVAQAPEQLLQALAQGNDDYQNKFGFIFIVCATGKSAGQMLQLLQQRLPNQRADEIRIAMEEQNKITQLRLQKLLA